MGSSPSKKNNPEVEMKLFDSEMYALMCINVCEGDTRINDVIRCISDHYPGDKTKIISTKPGKICPLSCGACGVQATDIHGHTHHVGSIHLCKQCVEEIEFCFNPFPEVLLSIQ